MFPFPLADGKFDSTPKGINLVNHILNFHNLLDASIWLTCAGSVLSLHRRTGNFLPGGAVNHLPKKISQVAQIFMKESK